MKSSRILLAASFVVSAGCGQAVEEGFATAVVSSALQTTQNGGAGREVVDAVRDACVLDAGDAAEQAAAHPIVGLYPTTCAQKSVTGDALHVELDDCTGAFGKVRLHGGLDATFSVLAGCTVRADIQDSGDLTANDRALDYAATADITPGAASRQVAWNAAWSTTTPRGFAIDQTSALQVFIDDATGCIDASGEAHGHTRRFDYTLELDGLALCPGACPTAGWVRAELDGPLRDRALRVDFDGSDVAHVTGFSGRQFDVPLVCDTTRPDAVDDAG